MVHMPGYLCCWVTQRGGRAHGPLILHVDKQKLGFDEAAASTWLCIHLVCAPQGATQLVLM